MKKRETSQNEARGGALSTAQRELMESKAIELNLLQGRSKQETRDALASSRIFPNVKTKYEWTMCKFVLF